MAIRVLSSMRVPCAAAEGLCFRVVPTPTFLPQGDRIMIRIRKFIREIDGPTSVEYAVLLAGIIALCISGITLVGGGTQNFWNTNRTQLDGALGGGS